MSDSLRLENINKIPYSMEAERAVLGAIIVNPSKINELTSTLRSDDFFVDNHRAIYDAMQELFLESRNIDPVTLLDMLVKSGTYSEAGGKEYIAALAEEVPDLSNTADYARIIKDKAILRRLISASEDISEMAYSGEGKVNEILDRSEQKIFDIAQGVDDKAFVHIKDVLVENYNQLQLLIDDKEAAMGTPTYFKAIDKLIVGMGKSDLVLVGARPGMGKTSFCLNIASSVAMKTKKTVAIFSLEMTAPQLVMRMLSSEAMIDSYKLRTAELDDKDWEHLGKAATVLSGCNILIDDTSNITISNMKAKLRRVKNLGLVVIDYLQLMQSDRHSDNRVLELGDISRGMKLMAKELQVPVVTCVQLNRGTEGRQDKTPMLSDIRDSGSIEQDADIVMFLYREAYYDSTSNAGSGEAQSSQNENIASCIVAKNRHGEVGKAQLGWYGKYTKFIDVDIGHEDPGR